MRPQQPSANPLMQAMQHFQSGNMERADELCKKLPHHADALHMRGLIAHQQNRHADAIELIAQAIRTAPTQAGYYPAFERACRSLGGVNLLVGQYSQLLEHSQNNALLYNYLGNALNEAGHINDAAFCYWQTTFLAPQIAEAWANLGMAYMRHGYLISAVDCFEQAIAKKADFFGACNDLGATYLKLGKLDAAVASFEKALVIKPDFAPARYNLGRAFNEQKQWDNAVACFNAVLSAQPGFIQAHVDLATACTNQHRIDEAIAHCKAALAVKPDYAEAHCALGDALTVAGRDDDAITSYQAATLCKQDYPEAFNGLGAALEHKGKLKDAITCYDMAVRLKPDFAIAWNNLGHAQHRMNRLDEGIACFLKALEYQPDHQLAYSNLLLALQYTTRYTQQDVFEAHLGYARQFETPLRATWPQHVPDRSAHRLRIGYLSPDFRQHPVANFFEPLLAHHDRSRFEVFCYSNLAQGDAVTARLQALAEHWVPCKLLSDEQLAERIRTDGIDVLVDLAGHTAGNRLSVFARKPAPVQVTWLGYVATTGLSAIDYRFTDAIADPSGMTEHLHSETLWRLPESFFCYRPYDDCPEPAEQPPALKNGFVTFGCLNNFSKVSDDALRLWAEILQRVPSARLMLAVVGHDEERLARLGLPQERLIVLPRQNHHAYLSAYRQIDIALDPFPFNGGTTSLDTLYMGVPFIALAGDHFTARMGAAILSHAGLQELVTDSEEQYVDLAVRLTNDLPRLSAIRFNLRQRLQASPLMDAPRFARHVEEAFTQMWIKCTD